MVRSLVIAAASLLLAAAALAQDSGAPVPLIPETAPRSFGPRPLPPPAPARETELPGSPHPVGEPQAAPGPAGSLTAPPETSTTSNTTARIFCHQPVTVRIADRESAPERYRRFLGIWSDAAWTAQLCAALIVENVAPDGTATIVYAFGPIGSNARTPGGVLNGTGVVRDGELRFQNSDGSQFAFRPLYADLAGRLIAPQGQTYQAIFKKTP